MRVDECIHSSGVSGELLAIIVSCRLQPLFSCRPDTENALSTIMLKGNVTDDFGKFARRGASHQVHLEQPVLGSDVSLRKEEVVYRSGLDSGNSVTIARDADRRGNSRNRQSTIKFR